MSQLARAARTACDLGHKRYMLMPPQEEECAGSRKNSCDTRRGFPQSVPLTVTDASDCNLKVNEHAGIWGKKMCVCVCLCGGGGGGGGGGGLGEGLGDWKDGLLVTVMGTDMGLFVSHGD